MFLGQNTQNSKNSHKIEKNIFFLIIVFLIELETYIRKISFLGQKLWPITSEQVYRKVKKVDLFFSKFRFDTDLNLFLEKKHF